MTHHEGPTLQHPDDDLIAMLLSRYKRGVSIVTISRKRRYEDERVLVVGIRPSSLAKLALRLWRYIEVDNIHLLPVLILANSLCLMYALMEEF